LHITPYQDCHIILSKYKLIPFTVQHTAYYNDIICSTLNTDFDMLNIYIIVCIKLDINRRLYAC